MRRDRTKSVMMVANHSPETGYAWWLMEHYWVRIARLSRARGLKCLLAYPTVGNVPPGIEEEGIIPVVYDFRDRSTKGRLRAFRSITEHDVRYLYLTDRAFFDWGYFLFRLGGVRKIMSHDHTPGDRPPVRGLQGMFKAFRNRLSWFTCDIFVSISPLMMARAISNGRVPETRIALVKNGIEPLSPQTRGSKYPHAQFGIPESRDIIVSVGRANRYKRIDFVLRVAKTLQRKRPDAGVAFLYLGDGPDLENLKEQACDEGLYPPFFVFGGRRSDIRQILPDCRYAIHPSMGEGLSLSILEFMSAGLITLVPDIPSVSQTIEHFRTGLVYPDSEESRAVELLTEMIDNPAVADRISVAARQEISENYDLDDTTPVFDALINEWLTIR